MTPSRSVIVYVRPSAEIPPLSTVGTSTAMSACGVVRSSTFGAGLVVEQPPQGHPLELVVGSAVGRRRIHVEHVLATGHDQGSPGLRLGAG